MCLIPPFMDYPLDDIKLSSTASSTAINSRQSVVDANFKAWLANRQYKEAVIHYVNLSLPLYIAEYRLVLADVDARQALIEHASPDVLLRFSRSYFTSYPDITQGLLSNHQKLSAISEENLQATIIELLDDGSEADSGLDNEFQQFLKLLIEAGLDPNRRVRDRPLFLAALDSHNYGIAQYLLSLPGLNLQLDYLTILDIQLQPILALRSSLAGRLGAVADADSGVAATETSRKRGRYD